ncbi:sensor histidine kinase [Nocardia cyriacigeorgica]|uniref:sensor histidine kinase n=1 Tax=Nocardia cyriacigeorgica TaxID=135487 RepID=UPI0013D50B0C|nr:nitrate- and nitrite sensing domain-containing protein [Nocardia cyriacigeorgica]NEW26645.1 histidine kinase [Nocardia cyriacigeorgica]
MASEAEPGIDEQPRDARRRGAWRARFGSSVRTRILAIALIPSAVLFLSGAVLVAALGVQARSVQRWADYRATSMDSLLSFVDAVQSERTASMAALTPSATAQEQLRAGRDATDRAIQETTRIAAGAQDIDQNTGAESIRTLGDRLAGIAALRHSVDSGHATIESIDRYYSGLLDATLDAGDESPRHKSSGIETMDAELTAMALARAAENHSRVVGFVTGAGGRVLSEPEQRFLAQLLGIYREQFDALGTRLAPQVRAGVRALIDGPDWQRAAAAEDELAERGTMTMPHAEWLTAEQNIGAGLNALMREQFRVSLGMTRQAADRMLWQLAIAAGLMLAVTAIAVLLSLASANRLLRRLRALRSASLALARDRLPAIVQSIHQGERVDVAAETAVVDRGGDEIGQVAEAFALAQHTAIDAAVAEARTRDGFNRVFLDIAFRSQALVRRQLEILDVAEARQENPEDLELLFQLDHLATRARRNAENLLILGGRRPGRRWRDAIALDDVVRGAVSETEGYARVGAVRQPAVRVLGAAVADLIHLLAELIDNATAFSPPDAPVAIHGNSVGRGVVVEIEDQGLGLGFDERARLNRLLAHPPQFHDMALAGERHLGLFVVSRLAARHGVTVSLQESAYGGVNAIVLLPWALLEREHSAVVVDAPDMAPLQGVGRLPSRRGGPGPLVPQVRTPAIESPGAAAPFGARGRVRAPGSVRAAMSSLQRGTRQARRATHHPDD